MITNEQKMNPFYPTPVALGEDNMTIEEALKLLSEYYFASDNIEKEYKEAIKFAINKFRNDIELKKAILKSSLHNRSEKKCNCIEKMNPFYPTPFALGEDNMTIEEALKLLSEYYFVSRNIEKEYKEAIKFAINNLRNNIELKKAILNSSLHNKSEKKCNCIEKMRRITMITAQEACRKSKYHETISKIEDDIEKEIQRSIVNGSYMALVSIKHETPECVREELRIDLEGLGYVYEIPRYKIDNTPGDQAKYYDDIVIKWDHLNG